MVTVGTEALEIWDLPLRLRERVERLSSLRPSVAFSPDRKTMMFADGAQLREIRVRDGRETARHRVPGHTVVLGFSADGRHLACSIEGLPDRTGDVRIIDRETGREHLRRPLESTWAARLAPHAPILAYADAGQEIVAVDLGSGSDLWRTRMHRGIVRSIDWASDGAELASADSAGVVRLWDGSTGRPLRVMRVSTEPIDRVRFLDEGNGLAVWWRDRESGDEVVEVWNARAKARLFRTSAPTPQVPDPGMPDECWLISAGSGPHADTRAVHLTSGATLRLPRVAHTGRSWVSPDGHWCVAAHDPGRWKSQAFVHRLDPAQRTPGHQGKVTALAFSANGSDLSSAGTDHTVRLWNLSTATERWFAPTEGVCTRVSFAPGGGSVLAAGTRWAEFHRERSRWSECPQPLVRLDQASGRLLATRAGLDVEDLLVNSTGGLRVREVGGLMRVLHPDDLTDRESIPGTPIKRPGMTWTEYSDTPYGLIHSTLSSRSILSTGSGRVALLNHSTGWCVRGPEERWTRVPGPACSAGVVTEDDTRLAIGCVDGSIVLWNVEQSRPEKSWSAHDGPVTVVAFSQDARWLASGSEGGIIRIWAVGD